MGNSWSQELLEQYILAGSVETSHEKLKELAENFCDKIRLRVAENLATPPELLWNLAHDTNPEIRVAVGSNPAADESVLNLLARDSDIVVRHGLAQSIDTSRKLLEILANDDNGWVCGEAVKSLAIIDSTSGDEVARQRDRKQTRARMRIHSHEEHADLNRGVAS